MLYSTRFGGPLLCVAFLAPVAPQQPASWRDPSPHTTRFVTVEKDVRLEVLDWGGSGRALVLLAGGGNTAHVFDEFAPKLTPKYHVYGITRRGFGASGYAPPSQATDRLADDVLAVLDALGLSRPVLAGHSIAGAELTSIATSHPERVAGLVYLDAGYPYAFDNGKGPAMKEFQELGGPPRPSPSEADLASFGALQRWDTRTVGFRRPEAEFRQGWDSTPDGRPLKARSFPGYPMFMAILTDTRKFSTIQVPALVIFAVPETREPWITRSSDPAVRKSADAYDATLNALKERQAKAIADGVPGARVVRLPGTHFVFLSNEKGVLREMRSFLARLK